jgi:glutamate-1-semialdehyde 2,1-aminomutase
VLIFDEVITGFGRVRRRPELYGVRPDLTCLGKIIGGGLPVGAYGGSRTLMSHVAPLGAVYQAGTLSGNPLAVAAGLATWRLRGSRRVSASKTLGARARKACAPAPSARVPLTVNRVGSMLTGFFCEAPVTDYDSPSADTAPRALLHGMLERGVLWRLRNSRRPRLARAHGRGHRVCGAPRPRRWPPPEPARVARSTCRVDL